ncbi:RING-H2 finger protein ATL2 [Sesamum alatum]|uniref:RING-type E3 ubiquitin transferase n=1 Tax=Sesamum alatum TaxID=300844 RepID=A0AAE1Y9Y4_9LAMI|nr:RING-H2 finger protein ATL2 [Sesamum alatum]
MGDSDHQELRIETDPGNGYALSGKIMLSAIVVLFAVVVFMVGLHLYARWYLIRLRRRQLERRRQRRMSRTQIVLYADGRLPGSADRGLELPVLNSLPVFLYTLKAEQPPAECAVCLSEFEDREIVRLLPKCNHSFHIECIDMWFRSHSTCPLCRSSVEKVAERIATEVRANRPVQKPNSSEPGCSSGAGLCSTCRHEEGNGDGNSAPSGGRRKRPELVEVRIDVPPRRPEWENELSQSSPASRLLSLKRILSMGRKSPAGGGPATPCGAGTSRGAAELDVESGIVGESSGESGRVQTPIS